MIDKIKEKGARIAPVIVHIGLGTFRPVQVEDLTRHQMDSEYFEVPAETAIPYSEEISVNSVEAQPLEEGVAVEAQPLEEGVAVVTAQKAQLSQASTTEEEVEFDMEWE